MRDDLPVDENYYQKILDNFDTFCDEFEFAAAKRFSGVDNDSRQPVDNAEVQRVTPTIVREIDTVGEEDITARTSTVDVPSTTIPDA
jgi:hypothetical protein|tara:strand:- start:23618 stop:23878 length:261 start_codon:yes stop_codon:yes gene_type:complete